MTVVTSGEAAICNGSVFATGSPSIIEWLGIGSVSIGIESYADVARRYVYVDKTMFIAVLLDRGGVTFFCRPRRFGKSLALRTLLSVRIACNSVQPAPTHFALCAIHAAGLILVYSLP